MKTKFKFEIYTNLVEMEVTKKQYLAITNQCRTLFENKMADYGAAWRILRLPSLTDQIFIKAQRIRSLQTNKEQKVAESQESEFIGIVNYSVMALIQIEKGIADKPDFDTDQTLHLFDEQIRIIFDLMIKKNYDYGEAWREMRVSSLTDLILQKLLRVKQIEENSGKTLVSEGIDANYHDMVNYAVFALIHLQSEAA